jgi:hypothetical protein
MATYDLPAALKPVNASWGLRKSGAQFTSPFNGTTQSLDYVAERWAFSTSLAPMLSYASGDMEVLGNLLAGGVNRLRAGHPTRKQPMGTLRGSPTVQTAAARGNASLAISATTGQTLESGDYIGVSGHLLQVAAPAVSVGGVMTVQLVNRIRGPIATGTAVVWNEPKALFICQSMQNSSVHMPGFVEGMALDFIEVYT